MTLSSLTSARAAQLPVRPFAVIGDTQRTLSVERVFLLREQNDEVRPLLISSIVADLPEFLIHLGDMTNWGSDDEAWKYFDTLIDPLKKSHIDVFPVMGNHEYFGFSKEHSLKNVEGRFPQLAMSHWYSKKHGPLALVFLDSNEKQLGATLWQKQVAWYEGTLKEMDSDPTVRGILIFAHHPALSNSKVSGDEECVRKFFLGPLLQSKKTLAYIDGHAHGYEHFVQDGKHFIVSGGGGGPRVEYRTGKNALHPDLYQGSMPRPFHYLIVQSLDDRVQITVKGLQKNEAQIGTIDQIAIPFAR